MAESQLPPPAEEPPNTRAIFQFSLRTLLALTAGVAWVLAWVGGEGLDCVHYKGLACVQYVGQLGAIALIEAGIARTGNFLQLLVRNLAAFFVCSLVFCMFGFALVESANPPQPHERSRFFQTPFDFERASSPHAGSDEANAYGADATATEPEPADIGPATPQAGVEWTLANRLMSPLDWAMAIAIAHLGLVGRVRWPGYVALWVVMAGLIMPLLECWRTGPHALVLAQGGGGGWLARIGFHATDLYPLGGWAALAASLVNTPQRALRGRPVSLSAACPNPGVVAAGWAAALVLFALVPLLLDSVSPPGLWTTEFFILNIRVGMLGVVAGLGGTALGSLAIHKRLRASLLLAGGIGGGLVVTNNYWPLDDPVRDSVALVPLGFVGGTLVVASSWLFARLGIEDPAGSAAAFGVGYSWANIGWLAIPLPGATKAQLWPASLSGQVVGVLTCFVWPFFTSLLLFWLIKRFAGVRPRPAQAPGLN